MASENGDSEETANVDRADGSHGPRECMPCRGTGQVISNLGDAPKPQDCPWCEGSGTRIVGIDAQARWASEPAGS